MNCAFEDCRILDELLDQFKDEWKKAIPAFYQQRKMNTDAVAQMSMDNYYEIHSDIRRPEFILKKQVEREIMQRYPEQYVSKHVLVMFTNTPYARAMACGKLQDELLDQICASIKDVKAVDWTAVESLLVNYDKKLANI